MKKKLITTLMILLLLAGGGTLFYPMVSNLCNTYRQKMLIAEYETTVSALETEDYSNEWEKAEKYNKTLEYNALYADVFENGEIKLEDTEYWEVLNVAQDGIMGYLSIPKIDIELAIYHGAEEKIIQTGVGHVSGTMLPIGGDSTHSVLVAHRGLPKARLFTDIDQLQQGDMFYVYILDKEFVYQVDQILSMVKKDDAETLGKAFAIEEGKSQITLFTCTPYGINSHRLLVRGTLVGCQEVGGKDSTIPLESVNEVQSFSMVYILLAITVVIVLVVSLNRRKRNRKKK